ncbi:hypothetical protein BS47DRAFT_1335169 [Hydnum rufescens UP504]|uniref:Uncharacterized protein n=1 Tax=Hydnum rufescens UP504 TaxID=1448309 RepID=A0A9P6AVN7_9AGAM|nr:hypothetical protein BS47DRAFT_1354645 [Hydnum rufescens UP504]KAF9504871.1 hypothetical protein BS47DRAFT_1354649 [Hydnum rufescens UP504]KAF9512884.1 hypothetical protein BS47DRAFT_1344827 [Hydnum rufescens UP504]KAF9513142.1 hypothetical protein BS47DRAFT_1344687 [Hydnum rufescens UP504]KAF9521087.1 hypothetical protein BS47DRAFT_1335169 [Hydnum rufescens UP504]
MEALQMLKFRLKKDRLNFTKDWETPITDMTVDPDNSDVLGEVLSTQSTELDSMLDRLLGEED